MVYVKQTWVNEPTQTTPISADRLNHLETQFDEAKAYTDSVTSSASQINVKSFGAAGDGVRDDSASIQSALDSVPSEGAVVLLPPGIYKVTSRLRVRSNTSISAYGATIRRGSSAGILICNWPSSQDLGSPTASTTEYNGWSNITISGLTVDGNSGTFTSNTNLVTFNHGRNISVFDMTFQRTVGYHALEFNAIDGFRAERCVIEGFTSVSGLVDKEAIQIDCASPGDSGLADDTMAKNGVIRDIVIRGLGSLPAHTVGVGSHTLPSGKWYKNIIVDNVVCEGSTMAAVWGLGWKNAVIRNSSNESKNGFAVRLHKCDDVSVSDCSFYADSWTSGTAQGFNITNDSSRVRIENAFVSGGNEGIYLGTGTVGCVVSGSVVTGVASYGLVVESAQDATISGGFFSGGKKSSATLGTIRITGTSTGVTVSSTRVAPHGVSGTPEAQAAVSVNSTVTQPPTFLANSFKGMPSAFSGTVNQTQNGI